MNHFDLTAVHMSPIARECVGDGNAREGSLRDIPETRVHTVDPENIECPGRATFFADSRAATDRLFAIVLVADAVDVDRLFVGSFAHQAHGSCHGFTGRDQAAVRIGVTEGHRSVEFEGRSRNVATGIRDRSTSGRARLSARSARAVRRKSRWDEHLIESHAIASGLQGFHREIVR